MPGSPFFAFLKEPAWRVHMHGDLLGVHRLLRLAQAIEESGSGRRITGVDERGAAVISKEQRTLAGRLNERASDVAIIVLGERTANRLGVGRANLDVEQSLVDVRNELARNELVVRVDGDVLRSDLAASDFRTRDVVFHVGVPERVELHGLGATKLLRENGRSQLDFRAVGREDLATAGVKQQLKFVRASLAETWT